MPEAVGPLVDGKIEQVRHDFLTPWQSLMPLMEKLRVRLKINLVSFFVSTLFFLQQFFVCVLRHIKLRRTQFFRHFESMPQKKSQHI